MLRLLSLSVACPDGCLSAKIANHRGIFCSRSARATFGSLSASVAARSARAARCCQGVLFSMRGLLFTLGLAPTRVDSGRSGRGGRGRLFPLGLGYCQPVGQREEGAG
jgi:hypothetical protein